MTIAVSEENIHKYVLNRNEVERKFTRGSGNGGQNRNKVETVVVLTHVPTGLIIRCEEHRTQGKNEETAWKRLEEKLNEISNNALIKKDKDDRFEQIGYGNRNDKKRTYRIQDGFVIDHITEKKITVKELYKGNIKLLHSSNI